MNTFEQQWQSSWDPPFEIVDKGTGEIYFVNLVTGEAQWHRPQASGGGGGGEDYDSDEGVSRLTKTQAREIIRDGRCRVCEHLSCDGTATHGKESDRLPKRCKLHMKKGDVVKVRIDSKGKWGAGRSWLTATGKTLYYHAEPDEVRFSKPKNWVRMLVKKFNPGPLLLRSPSRVR